MFRLSKSTTSFSCPYSKNNGRALPRPQGFEKVGKEEAEVGVEFTTRFESGRWQCPI
jgi:hypothetical protein